MKAFDAMLTVYVTLLNVTVHYKSVSMCEATLYRVITTYD